MHEWMKYLNTAQLEAVRTTEGPLLVIAGAGSGKTLVIEHRVLHLVERNVLPESILLLTFTRRAAREMIARSSGRDPRCAGVCGGTFHAFGQNVLRAHATNLGISPSFTVLDSDDAAEALGRCADGLGFYDQVERFPDKAALRDIVSSAANRVQSVADVLASDFPHYAQLFPKVDAVRAAYERLKADSGTLDFDDLLIRLVALLERDDLRSLVAGRYRYIMVDEYQDTNALQGRIVGLLAAGHGNVCVVGDDAQSVYGFRGARRENILSFPSLFSGCRVVTLAQNYRSTQPVLDLANAVLDRMPQKFAKRLIAAGARPHGDRPRLLCFTDVYDEAEWVSAEVKTLRDEGVSLDRQAVLYRTGPSSIVLQAALRARRIPFQVYGGMRFTDTAHVKDVLAHLKLICNPLDVLAWGRALGLLAGVGTKTARRLTSDVSGAADLPSACEAVRCGTANKPKLRNQIDVLTRTLLDAQAAAADTVRCLRLVITYYIPLARECYDDWHRRADELDGLAQVASRASSVNDLVADLAVDPPTAGQRFVAAPHVTDEERPLTLSTIHSAKGLEWDVVTLLGVTDGTLPSSRSLSDPAELEEEQRLLYVAVTRARSQLTLTMHQGATRGCPAGLSRPSRFLEPPEVMRTVDRPVIERPTQPGAEAEHLGPQSREQKDGHRPIWSDAA